jgi:hypothetical protein
MRTLERAKEDAATLFTARQNRVKTQQHQRARSRAKSKPPGQG